MFCNPPPSPGVMELLIFEKLHFMLLLEALYGDQTQPV